MKPPRKGYQSKSLKENRKRLTLKSKTHSIKTITGSKFK